MGRKDISWAGPSQDAKGFCFGTEDGLIFWTNFDGKPVSLVIKQNAITRAIDLEAVAINLVGDRWLLVILTDRVLRLDLHQLKHSVGTDASAESEIELQADRNSWETDHDELVTSGSELVLS